MGDKTAEQCMSKWYRDRNKKEESNKWLEESTAQLSGYVDLYKSQEYRGPQLWGMVSEAMGGKWNAEQCMSKWYRDRSKKRRITCVGDDYLLPNQISDSHIPHEADSITDQFVTSHHVSPRERCAKWNEEASLQLDKLVDIYKDQDYSGSGLWNIISLQLNEKWTPSQCMSKWYRDKNRHKGNHLMIGNELGDEEEV